MIRSHLPVILVVCLTHCADDPPTRPGDAAVHDSAAGQPESGAKADHGGGLPDHGALPDGPGKQDAAPPKDSGGGAQDSSAAVVTYGQTYSGGEFHLGPVDYDETQWHNACAPMTKYAPAVRKVEGDMLAGLWSGIANVSSYCDACIHVVTAKGKQALLRVVTYGSTTTNSIDVSPQAYAVLNSGEYPRKMTWQLAKCPATGKIMYEFQTGSSEWWTSLWVRNARVPITKVEVKCQNHDFQALTRGSDGTLTDSGGFGKGAFTVRLTGLDGKTVTDSFAWPAAGIAGQTLTGKGNFL